MQRSFVYSLRNMNYLIEHEPPEKAESTAETQIAYTLDLAGNIKFVNAAGERLIGYSCEEARRMNLTELVIPELADYVRQQIANSTNSSLGSVYEVEIITKDRRRVVLEMSTHLVTHHGRPIEIRGIALPPIRTTPSFGSARARCLDADFEFTIL